MVAPLCESSHGWGFFLCHADAVPTISRPMPSIPPLPDEGGTGVAVLEGDHSNERHYSTIVFSSFRVPQGGMRD